MTIQIKKRNEGRRNTKKKILIVCEGEKTEPSYFCNFRVSKEICDVTGLGSNTVALVRKARELSKEGDYHEVWCVFDKDSFPKKNVDQALALAKGFGFKCAFSNESFELWYVLHFCYLDTRITRHDYCIRLTNFLGFKYEKNNPAMYGILAGSQDRAIKNATKLEREMCEGINSLFDAQPMTTVHHLVKRLNGLAKKQ